MPDCGHIHLRYYALGGFVHIDYPCVGIFSTISWRYNALAVGDRRMIYAKKHISLLYLKTIIGKL